MKNNKWVIVTGGAGGIGKSLIDEFYNSGYKIIATDISYKKTITRKKYGYDLYLNLIDIVKSEEYTEAFTNKVQEITSGHGINSLINNAATQILGSCSKLTRDSWKTTLDTNLSAPFFLSQAFIPDLNKNSGSIVNISSIHATQTKKEFTAYATSKAALSALTRNMVLDLGDKIRINAIEPAAISTKMLKESFISDKESYRKLESFHPIKRIGMTKEIAELAVFLCSNKAKFIQGACISASGGIKNCLSDPS